MSSRFSRIWVIGFVIAGCREPPPEPPPPPVEAAPAVSLAPEVPKPPEPAPAEEPPKKLVATELEVELRALAIAGKAPHAIAILFRVPVIDAARNGSLSASTKLVLSPRVEGQVRIDTPFAFTFIPSKPLAPEVAYTARLEALETRDGILRAPSRKAWTLSFATPAADTAAEQARPPAKPMSILSARAIAAREGSFIDIGCDDRAVDARKPQYDDDGRWSERSERCELSEDELASSIHLEPPVKISLGASRLGFRLLGDFKRGNYQLRIDAGARTIDGGALDKTFEQTLTFGARPASVSFSVSGRYLPRSAWSNLPLQHLNASDARLEVRQVPPENLVFWMSDPATEATSERTANLLLSEALPLQGRPDEASTTWIDLGARLPRTSKGLLEMTVTAKDAQPAKARILLTDLHLVVKSTAGGEEFLAWALDAKTMKPLGGATLELVTRSGRVLARCESRSSRACRLTPDKSGVDRAPPFAILARDDGDLTYLELARLKTEITDAQIAGEPYRAAQPYHAAIYTDRGVYRPGDSAHVVAILRDAEGSAPPANMPVTVEVTDPRNRVAKKLPLSTNEAGVAAFDLPFAAFADTGKYRLTLKVAELKTQESSILVEEFVPERMKLSVEMKKSDYLGNEPIEVAIAARYLFGSTPAGSRVEVSCRLEPATFEPKKDAVHSFGLWKSGRDPAKPLELGTTSGELSADGTGTFACPEVPEGGGRRGTSRVRADIAVFEAGSGRTTHAEASALVHPEGFYLGLSGPSARVGAGDSVHVAGVVVDWSGTPISAVPAVDVELVRLELDYQWWYEDGTSSYKKHLRPVTMARQHVEVHGGAFSVDMKPDMDAIAYLVRARAGATETALELQGSLSADWSMEPMERRSDLTPRPDRPSWIAISSAESIAVDQPAEIRFRAPHRGMALFTVETDRVLESEWKEIEAGEQTWSFVLDRFQPNVYVSVFLLKDPHLESKQAFLPDRAFGVRSIAVAPERFIQPLALETPKEVRSSSTLAIDLEVPKEDREGPIYATIAAVDEGILSLTRFATPDPLKQIFARRALGVETFETIGWAMVLPPGGPSEKTGGDKSAGDKQGRVQPVKPVALWSGVLRVPDSGKLRVELPVPQYRGALRVMAVAAGPKRMGRADAMVLVRDPLVVESTLPRFMSAGDEAEIPVFLTNLSGARQDVTVNLSAENLPVPGMRSPPSEPSPIELLGAAEQTLALEPQASGTVVFHLRALKQSGAAKLRVKASSPSITVHDEADVPLLPSGPRSRVVQRVALQDGKRELEPLLRGWVPTSEKSTFWITANPYGEIFDHLKYLLHYPYG